MANRSIRIADLPPVRGKLVPNAPLGSVGWFRTGGTADLLFKPADAQDLATFLAACPMDVPVIALGVLSNTIIRDGGVAGVVVRLGRAFADIDMDAGHRLRVGAAALDVNVAMAAAQFSVGALEFLSGIPGTIGGALRMNAGAYGTELRDVLVEAIALDRSGQRHRFTPADITMSYRRSAAPADWLFIEATLQGQPAASDAINARMAEIKDRRATTQPIRARTGGSTFANPRPEDLEAVGLPPDLKAWQLIDRAGCRGLVVGDAQMSELHCNFMLNRGQASATDLETLGETVRRRVFAMTGLLLEWEIKRLGRLVTPIDSLPDRMAQTSSGALQ